MEKAFVGPFKIFESLFQKNKRAYLIWRRNSQRYFSINLEQKTQKVLVSSSRLWLTRACLFLRPKVHQMHTSAPRIDKLRLRGAAWQRRAGAALLLLFMHPGRISLPINKPTQLQPCVACDEWVSELPSHMCVFLLFRARAMDGNTRPLRLLHANIVRRMHLNVHVGVQLYFVERSSAECSSQEIGRCEMRTVIGIYTRHCSFCWFWEPVNAVEIAIARAVIIAWALRKKIEKRRYPYGACIQMSCIITCTRANKPCQHRLHREET